MKVSTGKALLIKLGFELEEKKWPCPTTAKVEILSKAIGPETLKFLLFPRYAKLSIATIHSITSMTLYPITRESMSDSYGITYKIYYKISCKSISKKDLLKVVKREIKKITEKQEAFAKKWQDQPGTNIG